MQGRADKPSNMSDSGRGEASLATGTAPAAAVTRLNEPGTTDHNRDYAQVGITPIMISGRLWTVPIR